MSVALLAMAADGYWSSRELERLRLMACTQPLFRDVPSVSKFISDRTADLRAVGAEVLLESCCRALTPSLRETAYAWAVEIVQADGAVVAKKHAFLSMLAAKFAVSDTLARSVQTVTDIRRRTD
jgi:hypothetical protein